MLAGIAVAGWLAGWLTEDQLKNSQALAGNLQKDNFDDFLIFYPVNNSRELATKKYN